MKRWYKAIPSRITDDHEPGDLFARVPLFDSVFHPCLGCGWLSEWPHHVQVQLVGGPHKTLGHYIHAYPYGFFSEAGRQVFEGGQIEGIQWLPVDLVFPDGASGPQYWYMQILQVVSVLDMNRSRLDFETRGPGKGKIVGLHHPVFQREKLPLNCDLFRLGEQPRQWFVSERVRLVAEGSGLGFWEFSEIETSH